jgi:hypothetical protein
MGKKLNSDTRNQIAKMIRTEMGYGMMETCEAVDVLIEAMEHKPNIKSDVGYRMVISWEEYNLRTGK